MKKLIGLLFFTLVFINQGCNKICGECFTPPAPFLFELIDKKTGENLFTNGTYEASQIELKNMINNRSFEYTFIAENNHNVIEITSIGWRTETVKILLSIGNDDIFCLLVDAEVLSEDCCTFTRFTEISIEISEFELNPETGIYTIKV